MDNPPTKEQKQKFWEYWGFTQNTTNMKSGYHYEYGTRVRNWHCPDGQVTYGYMQEGCLPDIDLNNIFKYATLKRLDYNPDIHLIQAITFSRFCGWRCCVLLIEGNELFGESEDPALAFFWATEPLWSVKDGQD